MLNVPVLFFLNQLKHILASGTTTQRSQSLRRILDRIRSSLEVEIVLQTAVDEVAKLLGSERCIFFWYFKDMQRVQIVCQTEAASSLLGHYPLARFGTAAVLVRRGEMAAGLLPAQPHRLGLLGRPLIQSQHRKWDILGQPMSLLVPVKGQTGVTGFMACLGDRTQPWSNADVDLIQTIAQQLEVAISQAQLYETIQKKARREQVVNHITSQTRQSLDLRLVLSEAIAQVLEAIGSDRCLVHLVEPPDEIRGRFDTLPATEQTGNVHRHHYLFEVCRSSYAPSVAEFDTNGPITRWVIQHRKRVVITDVSQDPRIGENNLEYQTAKIQSCLVIPVQTQQALHAILYINQCSHVRYWSRDDQELAQAVADQLALSIQQAYLYTQLQHQAEASHAQANQLSAALHDLQQTQAQLIQSEKMSSLGRIVAGVAHEINNPVSFIYGNIPHLEKYVQGLTQLIQLYRDRTATAPEIQALEADLDLDFVLQDLPQTLRSMQSGAERIRQIVLSLRRFARLDEAEWKLTDLHDSLEMAIALVCADIPDHVCLIREYGQVPWVECYPQLLNQVFVNVLGNALDAIAAAPADSPRWIRITTATFSHLTTRDSWIRIAIADKGIGIPDEQQSRVFDPFFTTKDVGKGTGLGLTVSYQTVVHQHRGTINIESLPDGGTQLVIDLPSHTPSS